MFYIYEYKIGSNGTVLVRVELRIKKASQVKITTHSQRNIPGTPLFSQTPV